MWTVQHLLGIGSLMEFSSSCLHSRDSAPWETRHGPQDQNQHLKCVYAWNMHVLCFGTLLFSETGLPWWSLKIYLFIFYSHLISPPPGSVLWLWTALPSLLLNIGPWASGWVTLEPWDMLWPQSSSQPTQSWACLCAKSPLTPVGFTQISACRNSL